MSHRLAVPKHSAANCTDSQTPSLTNPSESWYLVPGAGIKMKGAIRVISRQSRCPKCGKKFQHIPNINFVCKECKTFPNRFYIDLSWQGRRLGICSDKQGQALDSYQRALNLLAYIQHDIDNHTFDPSKFSAGDIKKMGASVLLDEYLEYKESTFAPSCLSHYRRYVYAAKEYFKATDVREIRKAHLIGFKRFIEKDFKPKGMNSKEVRKGKTVKNYLDAFKTFMIYLKDELEIIPSVPAFPDVEVEEYDWKWIGAEEQILILSKTPEKDRHIIAFLMLHGCRPGEARALKCKHIDIKRKCITISSTFSGKVIREKRKGKRSRKVVIPIHHEFYGYLADKVSNNLPEAFIFTNPRTGGAPYTESSMLRVWDSVRKKAGISKELRLYDASRHSFASQLVNSDASLLTVSRLLGHSSTKMTEKYAHSEIEKLRADMEKLSLSGNIADVVSIKKAS